MLYDNAQLARVYLHAYQVTGNEFYKRITTEILDYVIREMTDANGGFYSSQDADSEGHEGKFFVWTPEEIRSVLGEAVRACWWFLNPRTMPWMRHCLWMRMASRHKEILRERVF